MTLKPGTTYYFRVKAITESAESGYSETGSVTTLIDGQALLNPLPATSPVIQKIDVENDRAIVFLQEPIANEYIEEYKITISTNSDFSSPLYNNLAYVLDTNTSYAFIEETRYITFTLGNLVSGTTYYLRIRSVNKLGQSGSTDTSFTTKTATREPIALGVTNLTAITARINWTKVTEASSYLIDVSTSSTFSTFVINNLDVGNVLFYDIPTLLENTTYYYRVRAKNGSVLSVHSNVLNFTTLDDTQTYNDLRFNVSSPTGLYATNQYTDSFKLKWRAVSGAANYVLDVSTNIDFSTFVHQNIQTTNTEYIFTGLNSGTTYYARVRASRESLLSPSAVVVVTTLNINANLSLPQAVVPTTILSKAVRFTWIKRNYAVRYRIELSTNSNFSNIVQRIFVGDVDNIQIEKLTPATSYWLRVIAISNTEISNPSNSVTFTTATSLPAISLNNPSSAATESVRLSWVTNTAYIKYRISIYKKIDFNLITEGASNYLGNGFWGFKDIGSTNNYLVDLFLESGTTYNYFITGETATGDTNSSVIGEFSTKSKAVIQLSFDGKYVEWSGNLNRLEIATDKDFKFPLPGFNPYSVENVGKFDIGYLLKREICYYIRGYYFSSGLKSAYTNTLSTLGSNPQFSPVDVTNTTALISWKKVSSLHFIQVEAEISPSVFEALSGHGFPINIGDVSSFYLSGLSADTLYRANLSYVQNNNLVQLSTPVYFRTNKYASPSDLATTGTAPTLTHTAGYDRFTITTNTSGLFLAEVSRRSDFLVIEQYLEFNGNAVEIIGEPATEYYIRIYKVTGSTKSNLATASVLTSSVPALPASLSTAPTLNSPIIVNNTEAILSWSEIPNAEGYVVEISRTNTFNILEKNIFLTELDINSVLVSGLAGTIVYYGRVYGYNSRNISNYSNIITLDTTP